MADSPYIFNVTEENFQQIVMNGSMQVPVLVDFWAEWCGPCQSLMPMLAKLADEYQGKFILAKINTDEQQNLAAQFGIRSLPTVKVFIQGQPVDEFMGAQPESAVREMINNYIPREADKYRQHAAQLFGNGQVAEAIQVMEQAQQLDPEYTVTSIELAQIYMQNGENDKAEALLNSLSSEQQQEDEVKALLAKLNFSVAQDAPGTDALLAQIEAEPDNLDARYQLALQQIGMGEVENGLENLLFIVSKDSSFKDGEAKQSILNTFEMLGGGGEVVGRYRRRLFTLLH